MMWEGKVLAQGCLMLSLCKVLLQKDILIRVKLFLSTKRKQYTQKKYLSRSYAIYFSSSLQTPRAEAQTTDIFRGGKCSSKLVLPRNARGGSMFKTFLSSIL